MPIVEQAFVSLDKPCVLTVVERHARLKRAIERAVGRSLPANDDGERVAGTQRRVEEADSSTVSTAGGKT